MKKPMPMTWRPRVRALFFQLIHVLAMVGRFVWRYRRWWVSGCLLGAFVGAGIAMLQPTRYRTTVVLSLEPEVFNQNTISSLMQVTRGYAQVIASEPVLDEVARAKGWHEDGATLRRLVHAEADAGALVLRISADGATPADAQRIAHGVTMYFIQRLETDNPRRNEADRLHAVILTPAMRAERVAPRPFVGMGLGALVGVGLMVPAAVWHAWRRRTRLFTPREAERVVQAPTLGVIPR
ncbi:hypothetical protein ARMA_1043 [Ardenticatena maritima]|uniref:Polysaccharide chain length determinant N-terminal domain-containing protein n=3 Tax=Ardenticatena maritima TaxID=872965 RepID=A0A0M9UCA4_9CHLR|nr:hypothetical protein ARMA_1043 [Ardenticatena maritima]